MSTRSLCLIFALLISLLDVSFSTHGVRAVSVGLPLVAAGVFLLLSRRPNFFVPLLLFVIPVLPFFRAGALNLVAAAALLGVRKSGEDSLANARWWSAALVTIAAAMTVLSSLDIDILTSVWNEGGVSGLGAYLAVSTPRWYVALRTLSSVMLAVLVFEEARRLRTADLPALAPAAGAAIAGVVALKQWMGCDAARWNLSPFWIGIERFGGTFTDPNALGVAAALLIPFFLLQRRLFPSAAAAVLLAAALVSGSRTFFLGVAAAAGYLVALRAGARTVMMSAGAAVAALALLCVPQVNEALQQHVSGAPLRVLRTLHPASAGEMLASRTAFTRLAVEAIREHPLAGAGLDRFYEIQPELARRIGIDLKGWQDNANNFYLQLFAELGLFGGTLLLFALACAPLSIWRAQWKEKNDTGAWTSAETASAAALFSLAVMLLTGPHLLFDEIKFLAAIFAAHTTIGLSNKRLARLFPVFILAYAVLVIVLFKRPGSSGLYAPESENGKTVRWSAGQGELAFCGSVPEDLHLSVRALHPDLREKPVVLTLGDRRFDLGSTSWRLLPVSPSLLKENDVLRFSLDRTWIPRQAERGLDSRALGVQFLWSDPLCR